MNIPQLIIELLKESDNVVVDGFGVFSQKSISASVHDDGLISPPSKMISFRFDEQQKNADLISFIARRENVSIFLAELELKKTTDLWKNQLNTSKKLYIDGLGEVFKGYDEYIFKGDKIESQATDFYGLEEINVAEIKTTPSEEEEEENKTTSKSVDYQFNNSILWIFLVAVPIVGLLYLGIVKQDMLFGKKSIEEISVKPLSEIKSKAIQKDSVQTKPDSTLIKKDSVSTTQIQTK